MHGVKCKPNDCFQKDMQHDQSIRKNQNSSRAMNGIVRVIVSLCADSEGLEEGNGPGDGSWNSSGGVG